MSIQQHSVVSVHYKVVDSDSDQLIDSSENKEPLTYLHAASNIIAGLEQAKARTKKLASKAARGLRCGCFRVITTRPDKQLLHSAGSRC